MTNPHILSIIKDLSVVKLYTNETGTIVHCYDDTHFIIEIDDGNLRDISTEEIKSVIWEPQ